MHVVCAVALAVVVNGIVYKNGWNSTDNNRGNRWLPPGWVIGLVWMVLFALLGYAHYVAYRANGNKISLVSFSILSMILFCAAYPFLSSGLTSGKVLNVLTLIGAAKVGFVAALFAPQSFPYLYPLFVWASWVNIAQSLS